MMISDIRLSKFHRPQISLLQIGCSMEALEVLYELKLKITVQSESLSFNLHS